MTVVDASADSSLATADMAAQKMTARSKPTMPRGRVAHDERQEHIVCVLDCGMGQSGGDDLLHLTTDRGENRFALAHRLLGGRDGLFVVPVEGSVEALDFATLACKGGLVLALKRSRMGRVGSLIDAGEFRLIEEDWWQIELVEDQDHHAHQQHKKLHGNLDQAVEQQAQAALRDDGSTSQVALYLRLVGPEVGHGQKETSQQTRPKRVTPARISREVD